jgi:hypothetical protein
MFTTFQKIAIAYSAISVLAFHLGLAQHRHDPQGVIGVELESLVEARFGPEYSDIAYDLIDSLVGKRDNIFTEYITDPYGTLRGCALFFAHAVDSEDECVLGIYKDGVVLWDSGKILTGYAYSIYAISDVNRDGKVEILITTKSSQAPDVDYMDIFSWDGSGARRINEVDSSAFNLTLLRSASEMFRLVDVDGDGIQEIQGYWSDEDWNREYFPHDPIPTRPWVTYSWNGELYGLWSSTPQVSGATFFPANRLMVKTSCSVTASGDSLDFRYVWSNAASSEQEMRLFAIEGFRSAFTSYCPSGWQTFGKWADRSVAEWQTAGLDREANVKPGRTTEGVRITTRGLPAIVRFYAQGCRPSPIGDTPNQLSVEDLRNDLFGNSFSSYTLGPVDPPFPFLPLGLLDTLTSYASQSRTLGWITSQTVADKYLSYFSTAKTQLEQNNTAGARTTLQSVLRDVDVDSSSALTSEAYALLRYNTEYLLDQLPTPQELSIDDLIALKHESESKGWIGDKNFVKELDNGLDNAKKHLARGDSVNCAKELEKFQEKVKKEYDKTVEDQRKHKPRDKRFVTEEGYRSLAEGAQKIIDRIAEKK